jgi:release factor glutamine methyltransferase
LTDSQRVHFGWYLSERMRGKPTQYITGHQEFWALDFLVNPSVLIPRPETELLVETALAVARHSSLQDSDDSDNSALSVSAANAAPAAATALHEEAVIRIADVGTGSGCIAIALATELPRARFVALDSSPKALQTAEINARRLGVASRIQFLQSDLLVPSSGEALREFDIIVSNPPYVATADPHVMREVREFEPSSAVFAGPSGLEIYSRLIPQAARALRPGGHLILELGYDAQDGVRELLQTAQWEQVRWLPDLAGGIRAVVARRTAAACAGFPGSVMEVPL